MSKKKIEDLTKEETDKICKEYLEKDCKGCPFISDVKEVEVED